MSEKEKSCLGCLIVVAAALVVWMLVIGSILAIIAAIKA